MCLIAAVLYQSNRLNEICLTKIFLKNPTCKWAFIINFKHLQHSPPLSPSFKYTYTSLKTIRIFLQKRSDYKTTGFDEDHFDWKKSAFKIIHYSLRIICLTGKILDVISEIRNCWNHLKTVLLDMVHKLSILKVA